jgi:tetratricopeptide (TPR) repeat protein
MFLSLAGIVFAADVETAVSTRETYVGVPIVFRIQINNAFRYEPPTMPKVDGLIIESVGGPARSSKTTIINGRKTERSSIVFTFRVTPEREGSFTIPPIRVATDGVAMVSKAVRIIATKSEPSDLLIVEVEGKEKEIFVGEALNLTLKIWVRPYRDKQLEITLDEANMWNLISQRSNWGPFAESLQKMSEDNQRPGGNQVLRTDSDGNEREYLLYEIEATVYPNRPGQIDANDVRILLSYPLELGRGRSPFSLLDDDDFPFGNSSFGNSPFDDSFFRGFGSTLKITKSKPIVAEATVDQITVNPIPQQGRPEDYRGAVGQYSIITQAKPTRVKVGDPITLHIGVDGTGPMDLVRAPPIESQQTLTNDFKVPDEPLAGFVDGKRKVFSTTIRPLHDGVTEIPPVSFSYFDPKTGKFVTTESDPISIQVEKADVLGLDAIVGGNRATTNDATSNQATNVPEASAPNPTPSWTFLSGPDLLLSVPRPALISPDLIAILIAPPLFALAVLLFASRHMVSRLVSARNRLQRSLTLAETTTDVATALERFLLSRFRLSESRQSRNQTVGQLRASGYHDLAIRAERLYANCEKSTYNPTSLKTLDSLKEEALQIADELKRNKPATGPARKTTRLSSTSALFIVGIFSLQAAISNPARGELALTSDQQQALLDETISIYSSLPNDLPAGTWNEDLAKVAEKLELLVESKIENDRLFFNLATTQLRLGQTGKAIANYRRALRLDPANQKYREHLALAERNLAIGLPTQNAKLASMRDANDRIQRFVSPKTMKGLFISAWATFWGIIALRVLGIRFHWKTSACITLLCATLAAGSYFLRVTEFIADDTAVLVEPNVTIREGDGIDFAEVTELRSAEGGVIQVLDRRGEWIRIALESGTSGWIPVDTSEEI